MDSNLPLKPGGSTFVFFATPTASSATLVDGPNAGDVTYVFDNSNGLNRAWIGYGMTSAAAQNNAVIPTPGGQSKALPVAKGTVQAFTLAPRLFVATIMEMGSATLTCNIGMGL